VTGPFPPETESLLDRAAAICEARGGRLTALRREVLGLILAAPGPTGAYELLDRLRATRRGAAPPTVYRALDFLLAHGLIHKLERLAAFVGCVAHEHEAHAAQFLICTGCHRVIELEDPGMSHALADAAGRAGFCLRRATVEAEGLCAACAAGQDARGRQAGLGR
jgi:Fur family zinc uptake transcriptional regulator